MIGKTSRHARHLRQNSTEAEQLLWQRLRNRQLAGAKFRRQATLGPYVVDFLCVDAALIVEADGGNIRQIGMPIEPHGWKQKGCAFRVFGTTTFWRISTAP